MALGTDDRRQRIIRAAMSTILDNGLAGLRIHEVARRAGTSTGLVIYHFTSLEGLAAAAMAAAEDDFLTYIEQSDDPTRPAAQRLRTIIEWSSHPEVIGKWWVLWMELAVRALRDEKAAELRAAHDVRWRGKLLEIIEAGIAEHTFTVTDSRMTTIRLSAFLDGLRINSALGDPAIPAEAIPTLWVETAAQLLRCDAALFGDASPAVDRADTPVASPVTPAV